MMKLEQGFETIYVIYDYWDGPRTGIADYNGQPHWFENIFDAEHDNYSDLFWLTPISGDALHFAKQQAAMFSRWREAFNKGKVDLSSHPTLPEDRETYERLKAAVQEEIIRNAPRRFKERGESRRIGANLQPGIIPDFQVKWGSRGRDNPC